MAMLYERDVDRTVLAGRRVCVMGFGAQGKAHAMNLRDSDVDVVVGLRPNSASFATCDALDLPAQPVPEAVATADLVMLLVPDQVQPRLYNDLLSRILKPHTTLLLAHGYNVRFNKI